VSSLARTPVRWVLLAAVLGLAWLTTAHPVPLYDGIGFPDEPYRFEPPRAGTAAATTAQIRLPVSGGVNTGGLIANSAEVGPQVSFFAPPHAFAVKGTSAISVAARPVALVPPAPPGKLDSNVYDVSFVSPDGPVALVPAAQPPAITMRSLSNAPAEPVFEYRPTPTSAWRELKTRRVGQDISNANAPGAGQYVLVLRDGSSAQGSGSRTALFAILGATVVLVVGVLVGVRVAASRGRSS
jgi:hypothetical protein